MMMMMVYETNAYDEMCTETNRNSSRNRVCLCFLCFVHLSLSLSFSTHSPNNNNFCLNADYENVQHCLVIRNIPRFHIENVWLLLLLLVTFL